ncbi:hypothetical protein K788_00026205 [Paraburkholderia caribensis MBA4]|uniref:Uncharacterized protein n=1 Tax=Paraburkholderia caribensis MBA4 TaxID=1323664 RepID=A0A0P0RF78_9BURK|nr:hypothetical protein K788_00026205 [Paraburkholderia caribensis MBA4]
MRGGPASVLRIGATRLVVRGVLDMLKGSVAFVDRRI